MRVRNGVGFSQFQRAGAHMSVSVTAALLASSALAGGEGGFGGNYGDPNYPGVGHSVGDSASGTGGNGGEGGNGAAPGGAGGTLGNNGAAGSANVISGGGGGGGGSGAIGSGPINSNFTGGAGGSGGTLGGDGGGGGGGGGAGFVVNDNTFATTVQSGTTITGGAGGQGGHAAGDGGGGGGGAAIFVTSPNGADITVDSLATVLGGNGGIYRAVGIGGRGGAGEGGALGSQRDLSYSQGGAGIVGSDLILTISGTVSGGLGGDGVTRADAIRFTGGGTNALTFTNATSGLVGDINLVNSGLTLNQATNVTISNNLTGSSSSITKDGVGTVTLSGTNTFDQMAVYSGIIRANSAGALSSGAEYVLAGGTLDLNGHNLTTGNLSGSSGTLALGAATLTVNQSFPHSFGADITGTGSLTKIGTERLELTGTNTYSGGTTISAGTLAGNSTSLQGDIVNNATLELQGTGTFSGDISGTGDLVKVGGGTLTLMGTNSYSGGTTLDDGELAGTTASLQGDVHFDPGTTLRFDQSTNGTYAGDITGFGTLIKSGSGSVTLTGNSSTLSSITDVEAGRLAVNGQLGGDVVVRNGATLGGSGTIGSAVSIDAGGIFAPGNSIGTITVGGLSFTAGSFFDVEVDPAGTASDKTIVTGTANLTGATVRHIGMAGTYQRDATYRILDAAVIAGTFDAVTSVYAFLDLELLYGATFVDLHLVRNDVDIASLAETSNQRNTANALETTDHSNTAYGAIVALPNDRAQVQHALNQLSGATHASAHGALIQGNQFLSSGISDRLRASVGSVGANSAPVVALGGSSNLGGPRDGDLDLAGRSSLGGPSGRNEPELASANTNRFALWSQAFGAWGSSDGDGNAAALDRNTGGLLIGGDGRLDDWRIGAFTGYSRTDFSSRSMSASGESDNYHLGIYAGRTWSLVALRTSLSHTWHDIGTGRNVVFAGLDERLEAGYDAGSTQAFAELGYTLPSRGAFGLEAFANVAHVHFASDDFTETGGGAALTSLGNDSDVTATTLGLRAAYALRLGSLQATARGSVGWRHAFGDLAPENRLAFSTGDSFVVSGTPLAEDGIAIEAGLDALLSTSASLGLTYNGEVSAGTRDHGIKGDLSVRF